jgi:hypothetical protein
MDRPCRKTADGVKIVLPELPPQSGEEQPNYGMQRTALCAAADA